WGGGVGAQAARRSRPRPRLREDAAHGPPAEPAPLRPRLRVPCFRGRGNDHRGGPARGRRGHRQVLALGPPPLTLRTASPAYSRAPCDRGGGASGGGGAPGGGGVWAGGGGPQGRARRPRGRVLRGGGAAGGAPPPPRGGAPPPASRSGCS